ncbi:MAG: hypothetical protein ACUVXG_05675 [Anaerolineae bacterium]
MENISEESDRFVGSLTRLLVRYPAVIRHLRSDELTAELIFYVEELAMECAQLLLDAGITAVHRLDRPRVVSLQIPSLLAQHQTDKAVDILDAFLRAHATGTAARWSPDRPSCPVPHPSPCTDEGAYD